MVLSDLDVYYRSLDEALMRYHAVKMKEINQVTPLHSTAHLLSPYSISAVAQHNSASSPRLFSILALLYRLAAAAVVVVAAAADAAAAAAVVGLQVLSEYWRVTYMGKDIDDLYIKADPTDTTSSKRSYNYRVMMKQGDVELVMRGRCSAGQKVLACLLIRLALAETFCLKCGVLALDEPTTNLDEANIKSFAQALSNIIVKRCVPLCSSTRSPAYPCLIVFYRVRTRFLNANLILCGVTCRRGQKNFQLLLITHDDEFVEKIGKRANCDYYYRVFKDQAQHSKIRKQQI